MTWATAEDYANRILPFLAKLNAGASIDDAARDKVDKPFLVPKPKP